MKIDDDRSRSPIRLAIAALAALPVAACASTATVTLDKAIKDLAPDYRARTPASGAASLGRRLLGDQPETNACFDGDQGTAAPSWSKVTLHYGDVLDGKLSGDFGAAVKVAPSAGVSSKRSASITLTDLVESSLSAVYLDASGACTSLFAETGTSYVRVLTRAIKAGTLEVAAEEAVAATLAIDASSLGGTSVSASSTSGRRLQGTSLFFADYPECFSVVYQKRDCAGAAVGPGNVCDLDACSFNVAALDTAGAAWRGKLSCEGGASIDLGGTLGAWGKAQRTAPGVTYNVRVLKGAFLGTVNIDLRRWVTRSESPDKCAPPGSAPPPGRSRAPERPLAP
ncbi:hypothetical protein WMF26_26660 [Sorangium sp. So ce185]|uniref:hypothetical protein n=1 Tax=Sorangium sp. So ce185 TaxID=3133287 RepID=UPI003F5D7953